MSDLLIKPLRAYEDRGIIRDVDNEPYAAPVWLAKELQQLKLCEIVGGVGDEKGKAAGDGKELGFKLQKKGQKWIIVDAGAAQVGEFIGRREEAEVELAKLLASTTATTATTATAATAETASTATTPVTEASAVPVVVPAAASQPPADQTPATLPQE